MIDFFQRIYYFLLQYFVRNWWYSDVQENILLFFVFSWIHCIYVIIFKITSQDLWNYLLKTTLVLQHINLLTTLVQLKKYFSKITTELEKSFNKNFTPKLLAEVNKEKECFYGRLERAKKLKNPRAKIETKAHYLYILRRVTALQDQDSCWNNAGIYIERRYWVCQFEKFLVYYKKMRIDFFINNLQN